MGGGGGEDTGQRLLKGLESLRLAVDPTSGLDPPRLHSKSQRGDRLPRTAPPPARVGEESAEPGVLIHPSHYQFNSRPEQTHKMFALTVISILLQSILVSTKTHFVYWNSTNPVFRIDNTDNILDVNSGNVATEYDQMHLICPNSGEQHVVYSVSKEEYVSCRVSNPRPKIVAVCDKPGAFKYFTITFRSFSPTPGGLEFKPGQTYYLISTSTSRDLHRRAGGYCSSHNMKMVLNIAENPEQEHENSVSINVPRVNYPIRNSGESRINYPTWRTTEQPKVWSARVPQHRTDYIYYYKPWGKNENGNRFLKIEPLSSNNVLSPLPLTSSSSSSETLIPSIVLLILTVLSRC